jgi:thymidylate synthase
MNCFGLTQMINSLIRIPLMQRTGKRVLFGRLNWQADSWHIYGKDRALAEKYIERMTSGEPLGSRVIAFNDGETLAQYYFCTEAILEKVKKVEEGFKERK